MIDLPIRHTCVSACQESGGEGGEWEEGRGGVGDEEHKENEWIERQDVDDSVYAGPQATSVCGLALLVYAALRC